MHNLCLNPDAKPPLSLSFNHSSYLFDATFERNPLLVSSSSSPKCCCSCCSCCCGTNISVSNTLPSINPSYICRGLSQSTLIQLSFCKKLIFYGGSRSSCGNTSGVSSFTDIDRNYSYQKLSSFKERRKMGYEFRGFGHKRKTQSLSKVSDDYVDDVEVMLSLMINEVGLESTGVKDRIKINKKHICDGKKKKNVDFRVPKRDLKCDEVVEVRSTEEDDILTRTTNLDSSSGELEGDKDFEAKNEDYVGGKSSSGCRNNDRRQECDEERQEILEKEETVKGCYKESIGVSQDWRKKSEKKLNLDVDEASRQQISHEVDRLTDESRSSMKEIEIRGTCSLSNSRMKSWEENSTEVCQEKDQKTDHLIRLATGSIEKSQKILGISNSDAKVIKDQQVSRLKTSNYSCSRMKMVEGTTNEGASKTGVRKTGRITTKGSSFQGSMPKESSRIFKALNLNPEAGTQEGGGGHGGGESSRICKALNLNPEPDVQEGGSGHGGGESSRNLKALFLNPEPDVLEVGGGHGGGKSSRILKALNLNPLPDVQEGGGSHAGGKSSRMFKALNINPEPAVQEGGGEPPRIFKALNLIPEPDVQEGGGSESSRIFKALNSDPEPAVQEGDGAHGCGETEVRQSGRITTKASGFQGCKPNESSRIFKALNFNPEPAVQEGGGENADGVSHEEGEQDKLKTSNDGSGICDRKDNGSRHSSQGSGPKGPSDEMWHVTDASTQEPSETDVPDNTSFSSENEALKGSSRSLWTIIGDVVRLRWPSPRSETHTPNSGGGKGSSYLSASSEAWFSGQEPDDSNDDNGKKTPLPSSNNTSLPIIKESSFPFPAIRMRRSPEIKKTDEPAPSVLTEISQADASGIDSKNGELNRRKLDPINQLSKDNFDEWEEAYTIEARQRKNDEKFMREALLEAKKAANLLEVPVGAVLVQGGKIIARGHNLVEELRDSTAHAEMICIRQASTNLRSWRLLDTTLYVTLEPCPMCAGAILQARIDTIVWGAPNKLLGADGSWIRLFGDGDGGNGSTLPDTLPAPIHPFLPNMAVRRGVLAAECAEVMQQFFRQRRRKKPEPGTLPSSSSNPIPQKHSNLLSKMHHAFNIIFCL